MEGKLIKVMSHTNCEEAELFLNGKSLGKKLSPIYEQATWEVPYEVGTRVMKGFRNGIMVAEERVTTEGDTAALRLELNRDFIFGDGADAIPVNVSAMDSNGNFVPIANNKVKFIITGLGKIIGVGNGDPKSHEADIAEE